MNFHEFDWPTFADTFTKLLLAIAGLGISYSSLSVNKSMRRLFTRQAEFALDAKKVDLLQSFDQRYNTLHRTEVTLRSQQQPLPSFFNREGTPPRQPNPDGAWVQYWERFFDLQLSQHFYYKRGYVDDEVFRGWLAFRQQDFINNVSVGDLYYREAWRETKSIFKLFENGRQMIEVLDTVHPAGQSKPDEAKIDAALAKIKTRTHLDADLLELSNDASGPAPALSMRRVVVGALVSMVVALIMSSYVASAVGHAKALEREAAAPPAQLADELRAVQQRLEALERKGEPPPSAAPQAQPQQKSAK
jgi:hypothetical protein